MVKNSLLLLAIASSTLPLLSGCGSSGSGNSAAPKALSAQASLGEKIFKDTSLSASGVQACSTCHDPAFGHSPANANAVQAGDPAATQTGKRKTPGIRYLATNTAFFFDDEGTPTGGFFWDGRADTPALQAKEPFVSPFEMANADHASVITKLAAATYAAEFKSVFGAGVFNDVEGAYLRMTLAIQAYEKEDSEFNSYTSKFDAFLAGKTSLSPQELNGFSLFNNPTKGNCAGCHPSSKGADGSPPLFTDFTYDNLGVPRNPLIARNTDPAYFDLGICERFDPGTHEDLCGAFKVPSLRNVALRKAFFHNGKFTSLVDALTFYVQRDTDPDKWYPPGQKFNDLPAKYQANVNTTEVPYNRSLGQAPALTDAEILDVVAFLNTLTDGFTQ
ncbi:MAG: cytochrome c peroxidase [Betaproteobacteria bacterium]